MVRASTTRQAICSSLIGHPEDMTKRLIDVNDDKLDAARTLLGTRTLKATVDNAFDEVLALDKRRRALLAERGVDLAELANPDARQAAWREGPITWATPRLWQGSCSPRYPIGSGHSSRAGWSHDAHRLTSKQASPPQVLLPTTTCENSALRGSSCRWNQSALDRAVEVQDVLADRSQQRGAKIADLLIAAAAEAAGLVVLHYNKDFDLIAGITGQATEWIVPAGTIS